MNDPRIREILGSYGGNAERWPVDERPMVDAALAADARLRGEHAAARELDAMLDAWATRSVVGPAASVDADAVAARVIGPVRRPARRWWQVAASGGIAAALGALVMLEGPTTTAVSTPPALQAVATVTDEGAFATVFTTTPDEESVL